MQKLTELPTLRIGLIGSGFIAAFHLQSMLGVRNVSVGGVYSRSPSVVRVLRTRRASLV